LTHGEALSPAYLNRYDKDFKSLGQALQMAFLKQWDVEVLKEECLAQIKAFEQEMGFLPEFIDGHQHIHQFPRIREALVAAYKVAYSKSDQRAYVRFVQQIKPISVKSLPKLLIIYSSSKAFKKLLDTNHIPHNHAFSGIYPFSESLSYPNWFPKFLTEIQGEGLIMCHPGLDMGEDRDRSDPIAKARTYEYAYLASDQFNIDCKQQSAVLTRF
jgi:predicted glycoside hydrolase/deacetylase ChbG (UPF0249 family)